MGDAVGVAVGTAVGPGVGLGGGVMVGTGVRAATTSSCQTGSWVGAKVSGTRVGSATTRVTCSTGASIAWAVCFEPHPPAQRRSSASRTTLQRILFTAYRVLWSKIVGIVP